MKHLKHILALLLALVLCLSQFPIAVLATDTDTAAPEITVTADSVIRTKHTSATLSFKSDKAGSYYYAVVKNGETTPTIDTTGEGTAMVAGDNTITLSDLTSSACKLYLMAKDESGNVTSNAVEVEIPAFAVPRLATFLAENVSYRNGTVGVPTENRSVSVTNIKIEHYNEPQMVAQTIASTGKTSYYDVAGVVWLTTGYKYDTYDAVDLKVKTWSATAEDAVKDGWKLTASGTKYMKQTDGYATAASTGLKLSKKINGANVNYYYLIKMKPNESAVELPREYSLSFELTQNGDSNDQYLSGNTIVFTDESGNTITKAVAGTTVTATPTLYTNSGYCKYEFVEWASATGITLNETDKQADTLTFTMPDSDVLLSARFRCVGVTVTWESKCDNSTKPPEIMVDGSTFGDGKTPSRKLIIADGKYLSVAPGLGGDDADEWKLLGWKVTADGNDITNQFTWNINVRSGGYWLVPENTEISNIHIIANYYHLTFAGVGVEVNDSTMGTATAVVGTGTPAESIPVVFEEQIVTLTATPGERYTLDRWEVKDADGTTITVTTDAQDANKATFTMPGTGKNVTAKAFFKVDPEKASQKNELTAVSLYAADGSTLIKAADKSGTAFTITLPESQDTTNLASFVLKFTISDYATIKVKGAEENWPTSGKACNMTLDTPVTFVVTAENGAEQEYTVEIKQERTLSSEKAITAVKLLNGSTTIATGTLSGSTWTITLPSDTEQALLDKIGSSTDIKMQIDYTGASVAQEEGYDDASGSVGKWSSGNVMCAISPNSQASFTVTAEDGSTASYVIKITYTAPASSKPTLSGGSATRTSDTAATVSFTSSAAGSYYYQVVNSGAAEPEISTSGSGTSASAGTNTISLTNLTAGARDIYIVVKSAAGEVSDSLKIAIPAFGDDSGDNTPTDPDTGDFTIAIDAPTGGTITVNRKKANQGDTITVTATPNAGYQLVEGSLTWSIAAAGQPQNKIVDGKFTMPAANVNISCKWEKVQTVVSGITSFSIDGVQGVVDNTANTISVVMPYGTDVTQLIPTISGNNISSISPASGKMVNFTKPVIYTVTLADGSTKQYTVTVYVQKGTAADEMWDKLTDFYNQTPWWEYADNQISTGHYPQYW